MSSTWRARLRRKIYAKLPRWLKSHDFELFAAFLSILGGLPLVLGQVEPTSVDALLPPLLVLVWGIILVQGGILVILGVIKSSHTVYPARAFWIRIEGLGLSSLSWFCYLYAVCILAYTIKAGWLSAMVVLVFGFICHVRQMALQTKLEEYRMNLGLEGQGEK
jgi:hypothetical protein